MGPDHRGKSGNDDLFFLKTRIQDRIISCHDAAGIRIMINLNELQPVETYGRKLRYLMLDSREHLCEGQISEALRIY